MTADILRGLSLGRSNAEVAAELHISLRTLHRLLADVRDTWGVGTTMEAVVVATRVHVI